MRFKEVEEQEQIPEDVTRRRLNGKQPPPQYLKEMKLKRFEVDEGEAEVTKTVSLHDVYKHLDEWKESLQGELESQYGKGCLIPIKGKDALILAKESGVELKTLPTKLVAVKKKNQMNPQS